MGRAGDCQGQLPLCWGLPVQKGIPLLISNRIVCALSSKTLCSKILEQCKMLGQVLVLWALAFWILGYWLVPIGLDLAGLEREELSARGQALVHALQDLGQLSITLAVLWRALHRSVLFTNSTIPLLLKVHVCNQPLEFSCSDDY